MPGPLKGQGPQLSSRYHMTIHLLESYHQQSPLFKSLLKAVSSSFANLCLPSQMMTLDRILWVAGSIWAVGLASPKQWRPEGKQHCSVQTQNPPPMMELLHMYIHYSHSGLQRRGTSGPYLVNLRENHLATVSSCFISSFDPGQALSPLLTHPLPEYQAYHHQLPLPQRVFFRGQRV